MFPAIPERSGTNFSAAPLIFINHCPFIFLTLQEMETSLFPGSMSSHGHLHGLPAPYLLAAAAAHHQLNTSPPPPTPTSQFLPHPPPVPPHFPPYHALTRLTSTEDISQSVSKSASSVTAMAASLAAASTSNAKYSIASLTSNKDDFRYHR